MNRQRAMGKHWDTVKCMREKPDTGGAITHGETHEVTTEGRAQHRKMRHEELQNKTGYEQGTRDKS